MDRTVPSLTLGAYGCAHLGYSMGKLTRTGSAHGLNQRRIDSMAVHAALIADMVACPVDAILNLGDTFHSSHPHPEEVQFCLDTDDLAVQAGIPRYLFPGNHDVRQSDAVAATAMLHRPAVGSHSVHLGVTGPVGDGPVPGRYAIVPVTATNGDCLLVGGKPVLLHIVTPQGLPSPVLEERGIVVDPRPNEGAVNVLLSHGIVDTYAPDMADRAGPGRVIPGEWLDRGFDVALFGDIHTPGPITGHTTPSWYVGSAMRRGFSDPDASRGWMELTLREDAEPAVELHEMWQRPQVDLPAIDCGSLSPEQARDAAAVALDAQTWSDPDSAALTGDGGYLLRQPFLHATDAHHGLISTSLGMLTRRAEGALFYTATFPDRDTATAPTAPVAPAGTPATGAPANVGLTRTETVPDALARLAADPDSDVAKVLADFTPAQRQTIMDGTSAALEGK